MQKLRFFPRSAVALGVALCVSSTSAQAQSIVVTDLFGEADVRDEALALSLMLQSRFAADSAEGGRARTRLRQALTQIAGAPPRYALVADPANHAQLLKQLAAKFIVYGSVRRDGTKLAATLHISTKDGVKATAVSASAAMCRLVALANELIAGISRELQVPAPQPISETVSLGQLLPYVQAVKAQLTGDAAAAVRSLGVANSALAQRLRALREVSRNAANTATLMLDQRFAAALAAHDFRLAASMARRMQAVAQSTVDKQNAAAAAAIVALQQKDAAAAQRELKGMSRTEVKMVLLAQAMLANDHQQKARRDALLIKLFRARYVPALSFVAQLDARTLSPRVSGEAIDFAATLGTTYDALQSALAARLAPHAAALKLSPERVLPLIKANLLTRDQLSLLQPIATAAANEGIAAGYRLQAALALAKGDLTAAHTRLNRAIAIDKKDTQARVLAARVLIEQGRPAEAAAHLAVAAKNKDIATRQEYAHALELSGSRKKALEQRRLLQQDPSVAASRAINIELSAESYSTGKGGAQTVALKRKAFEELTVQLRSVIGAFGQLSAGLFFSVGIIELGSNDHAIYMPHRIHAEQLSRGIQRVLTRPPYSLVVKHSKSGVDSLSTSALAALADQLSVDAVLLYSVSASGWNRARVRIVLYDAYKQQASEFSNTLPGVATGLVSWNPIFVHTILGILVLLLGWVGYIVFRGNGEVHVEITLDPGAEQLAFTVQIDRNKAAPRINDVAKYTDRVLTGGNKVGRTTASGVRNRVRFRRVPTNMRYVHLIGTYVKEGTRHCLPPALSQAIEIKRGKATRVQFDLEPKTCALRLSVFDGDQPLRMATVWLDDAKRDQRFTDNAGRLLLQIPRNQQVIVHVSAGGMEIARTVSFHDTKSHDLSVNLKAERRMREMAGGIALDADALAGQHEQGFGEDLDGGRLIEAEDLRKAAVGAPAAPHAAAQPNVRPPAARDAKTEPASGSRNGLDRYRRASELGRGAMGVVYRAKDLVLERDVALKVMGDRLRQFPAALRMFMQEAKALAALNHPNVVTVFDQGQDGDETYMVMEFVEGETLESIIRRVGALPVLRALEIADQLCAGLAYAHGRQVMHRDIKPENIFLSQDGVVKIGDFGLARVLHEVAIQRTEIKGTPLYMAPEQIRGKDIDFRADIYSLGCTLFAMFTGAPPFTKGEILFHHLNTPPPIPSSIVSSLPESVDQLVLSCIAKDKQDRIGSVAELRDRVAFLRRGVTDLIGAANETQLR